MRQYYLVNLLSFRGVPLPVSLDMLKEIKKIQKEDREGFVLDNGKKDILFAGKLLEKGAIGSDLSHFYALHILYKGRGQDLANVTLTEQLRLEVFVRVLTEEMGGNTVLREEFRKIGEEIDKEWFYDRESPIVKQQIFIRRKLSNSNFRNRG